VATTIASNSNRLAVVNMFATLSCILKIKGDA
jgi:hypothetical protein